ncbi:MAG: lyase family protein, partial [Thermodesulfovibrionales bacterium]|nr:lyase family protein [Thermodesulfovibrionales bacterium]
MIERYTRKEMGQLWEPENRFRKWLDVEIAVCEAWAEMGEIPKDALEKIRSKAGFDIKRIEEIEKTVKHDVIAFLTSVGEYVGTEAKYIHKGLTSYDIVDTALSLLMKESSDIIIDDLKKLLDILKNQAFE